MAEKGRAVLGLPTREDWAKRSTEEEPLLVSRAELGAVFTIDRELAML